MPMHVDVILNGGYSVLFVFPWFPYWIVYQQPLLAKLTIKWTLANHRIALLLKWLLCVAPRYTISVFWLTHFPHLDISHSIYSYHYHHQHQHYPPFGRSVDTSKNYLDNLGKCGRRIKFRYYFNYPFINKSLLCVLLYISAFDCIYRYFVCVCVCVDFNVIWFAVCTCIYV